MRGAFVYTFSRQFCHVRCIYVSLGVFMCVEHHGRVYVLKRVNAQHRVLRLFVCTYKTAYTLYASQTIQPIQRTV